MRKKIDFRAVTNTALVREVNMELAFAELSRAWLALGDNERDESRLRKWLDRYGDRIAWSLTTDELMDAANHMLECG